MSTNQSEDPFRADAGLVWRVLKAEPGLSALEIAQKCFPWPVEGPESSLAAIRKLSMTRVFNSIVWMRHQKVVITAVPGSPSRFYLGEKPFDPLSVPRSTRVLTYKLSEAPDLPIEAPESVSGESIMDLYHQKS